MHAHDMLPPLCRVCFVDEVHNRRYPGSEDFVNFGFWLLLH